MTYFIEFDFMLPLYLCLASVIIPSANAATSVVRDAQGNKVINGGSYYIQSDMLAPDEASIWTNYTSQLCPPYVTQGYIYGPHVSPPATISLPLALTTRAKFIPVGVRVDITFKDSNTPCERPLKWSIWPARSINNAFYVVAGDENPHYKGYFKVVHSGSTENKYLYKFRSCTVERCMDVGWIPGVANYFFVTSDPKMEILPLYFVLGKV